VKTNAILTGGCAKFETPTLSGPCRFRRKCIQQEAVIRFYSSNTRFVPHC
jgi:hypothetical protein